MKFANFLEFKNKKELVKYVKSLFNFKVLQKTTKTEDDILSEKEIKLLINTAKSIRDKAIIEIFLTTGRRRKEINSLKYKDIQNQNAIIWVTINKSKTKPTRVPIVANKQIPTALFPENLLNYYNSHIFKDDPEKPFFYSNHSNRYGQPLNKNSINEIIRATVKKSGIKKRITPHILRHTGATYDGHFLTEFDLCQKYGFSPKIARSYCHITENQLGDHLLKIAGTTQEQIQKDSSCPNCKQKVNINDKICPHCQYILDREEQQKQIEKLTKEKEELSKTKMDIYKLNQELIKFKKETRKQQEKAVKNMGELLHEIWNAPYQMKRTKNNIIYMINFETKTGIPEIITEKDEIIKKDKKLEKQFKIWKKTYKKIDKGTIPKE